MTIEGNPNQPKWLTSKQLAARWQTHEGTIRHWRVKGKGPAYTKMRHNNRVRYNLADVEAWEKEYGIEKIIQDMNEEGAE